MYSKLKVKVKNNIIYYKQVVRRVDLCWFGHAYRRSKKVLSGRSQERMQAVSRDSNCPANVWNNLSDGAEGKSADLVTLEIQGVCKTKSEGTAEKHGTLVNKLVSREGMINNPETAVCIHLKCTIKWSNGKWRLGDGSQASHSWSGNLEINKGRRLEWSM